MNVFHRRPKSLALPLVFFGLFLVGFWLSRRQANPPAKPAKKVPTPRRDEELARRIADQRRRDRQEAQRVRDLEAENPPVLEGNE